MATWTNADGLTIKYGSDRAEQKVLGVTSWEAKKFLVVNLAWDALPTFTTDLNNNGTANGFSNDAFIPAGSLITKASLIVRTAFTSDGSATLTVGTYQKGGTVIDADGIDATVALAALAANKAVQCDGAQVGGTVLLTHDAYIVAVANVADFTAGDAKLVIEYITP